ncbi:MAG: efflux RND transporter permease subunit, partial [Planctomycetota bacterium]
ASKRPTRGPFKWFNSTLDAGTTLLAGLVKRTIRVAIVALVLFVGLVYLALQGFGALPTGFVPQEDEGYCIVNIQLPEGASLGRTNEVMFRASKGIETIDGVRGAVGIGGYSFLDNASSPNKAGFIVTFTDWGDRSTAALHQASIVRQINGLLSQIQESVAVSFAPPSLPGVGMAGGFALQLQDRGSAGAATLSRMAMEFMADGNAQDGLERMFSGFRANTPQLFVDIDREQVRDRNVELGDVFSTLQANMGSAYVNDFLESGRIYQVRTQALAEYRNDPRDVLQLEVASRDGAMIPLSTFADVKEVFGPQLVTHFNIYPSAKINGSASTGTTSGQAMEKIEAMARDKLSTQMGLEWTDLSYQEKKATGGMAVIFLFSIVLVYLVLAFQYESWALPLSVCFAVPGALMGAVAAVMVRQLDNNLYTQVGIVLLIGLSTKTAILIVEYAKVERDAGKSIADAAVAATRMRFRAVLMTAFSFILGVIPLLVASGAGGESQQAIGTTVFGGMLVATLIGVIFVPVLYFIIQRVAEKLGGAQSGNTEA